MVAIFMQGIAFLLSALWMLGFVLLFGAICGAFLSVIGLIGYALSEACRGGTEVLKNIS
jgi:hypothetical protein